MLFVWFVDSKWSVYESDARTLFFGKELFLAADETRIYRCKQGVEVMAALWLSAFLLRESAVSKY